MVTGRPPFLGDTPVAVASKHVRDHPPAPRELNPSIPPTFEAIILKAMAKDPAHRYATAEDLRADLLRFNEGRTVLAMDDATPMLAVGRSHPGGGRGGRHGRYPGRGRHHGGQRRPEEEADEAGPTGPVPTPSSWPSSWSCCWWPGSSWPGTWATWGECVVQPARP